MTDEARLRADAAAGLPTPISIAGWLRIAIRFLMIVALLLLFVPLHYLFRIFAYGSPFPRMFLASTGRVVGARVKVVGTPLRRDVFFVSNHVSWIDILAHAGASGTAFVAKAELAKAPLVGWLCGLNRTVFVQREARSDIAAQINNLREALADNWSITVFPEGTTTDGQSLLPFKSSLLKVLEPPPAEVLVQPVLLDYGSVAEELGWIGDESGVNNFKRVLARKGSFPVRVVYLEPFSPAIVAGRKAIAAQARLEIEAELRKVLGKDLREFTHDVGPVRYNAPSPTPTTTD